MQSVAYKRLITTKTTTTLLSSPCLISQIVITCSDAGSDWTLKIQDKASPTPFIIVPPFTLQLLTDGQPNVNMNFQSPLLMDGGIDIITDGTTAGAVAVWVLTLQ